jgi:hypothetical protein
MNALTDIGDAETALVHGQAALDGFRHVLGETHPRTLACAANVTVTLSTLAREPEATELRAGVLEHYKRTLGAGHPNVRLFAGGERFDPDFTPLPL